MPANLFSELPQRQLPEELFDTLLARRGVRIERIVSTGQSSPPGFWYDQAWEEWVLLLAGAAEPCRMHPGDWVCIASRRRHRVKWTQPDAPTVWLAVHIGEAPPTTSSPHRPSRGALPARPP